VTSAIKEDFLVEDLAVLDFSLSPQEVSELSALHAAVPGVRIVDDWPDVMMPMVAFSTAPLSPAAIAPTIESWGRAGGRHVDVAPGHEHLVQPALQGLLTGGVASRNELFVTARVARPLGYAATLDWANETMQGTMQRLDLLLIGAPCADVSLNCTGSSAAAAVRETWRALVELRTAGRLRSIGVANFRQEHLGWILGSDIDDNHIARSELRDDPPANVSAPCVNQVEFHPGWHDPSLLAFCKSYNVTLQAAAGPGRHPAGPVVNAAVDVVAAAHNVTSDQAALRWVLQQDVPTVVHPAREDIPLYLSELFDFDLTKKEMANIGEDRVE